MMNERKEEKIIVRVVRVCPWLVIVEPAKHAKREKMKKSVFVRG